MDPDELLRQAWHLTTVKDDGPSDADMRRAVSAGYYAIFHTLVEAAASQASPNGMVPLQANIRRTISHAQVKKACGMFVRPLDRQPDALRQLLNNDGWTELMALARALPELQEARHRADYDSLASFDAVDVAELLSLAQQARALWLTIRHTPNAAVFLTAVLLGERFGMRG